MEATRQCIFLINVAPFKRKRTDVPGLQDLLQRSTVTVLESRRKFSPRETLQVIK